MRRRSIAWVVSPRVEALHLIDGWDVPFAAAGVTRADAHDRDARRRAPRRSARVRLEARQRARDARRRRGGRRRPRRARRPARLDRPAPARARVRACPSRARRRSRRRAGAGSTPTRASPCSASTSRRGPRCRSRTTCARPSASRSGSGSTRRAPRQRHARVPRRRARARARAARTRASSRPRRTTRWSPSSFPGLDGVLPDFGRFSPLDWGLGVELKGAKEGHWSGSLTSPRTFGHFGGSGTFLWVDPDRGPRLRGADDAAVRRLGQGGLAAALGRRVVRRAAAQSET